MNKTALITGAAKRIGKAITTAKCGKAIGDELARLRKQALYGLLGNFQMANALTVF